MGYYNRYTAFMKEGVVMPGVPFIKISRAASDLKIKFDKKTMRMDTLSYKHYGDPNYGWLILQANPKYGGFEFRIDNGDELYIPYPLDSAIERFEKGIAIWRETNSDV